MGSAWRRAKLALGFNMCVYVPATAEEEDSADRLSDAALLSPAMPMTPTPSSGGLRLSKSASRSSKVCVAVTESSFITFVFGYAKMEGKGKEMGSWVSCFCAVLVCKKEETQLSQVILNWDLI